MHTPTVDRPAILHRDIKPANILLDESDNAKICDVGLARLAPELEGTNHTAHVTTRLVGTHGYIDPQYAADGHACEATDGYSAGVVLLQLLTGLPALDSKQRPRDLASRLRIEFRNPSSAADRADTAGGVWPRRTAIELGKISCGLIHPVREERMSLGGALSRMEEYAWRSYSC